MGKYFGTDGFRGEANVNLRVDQAFYIGRALGWIAYERAVEGIAFDMNGKGYLDPADRPRILIGKDTRRSGDMFESALAAGAAASGADVDLLGVVTTPGVAYLTRTGNYSFGVMVSASHNPYYDNGIKVLNGDGEKLDDSTTKGLEAYLDGMIQEPPLAQRGAIGVITDRSDACEDYARYLESVAPASLAGWRIGLDCANGSAYALAPEIYTALGAEVHVLSNEPDGENINVDCGSTHIGRLCEFVREQGLDLGFAYDGDADRCLAVDADGNEVNGDQLMYFCALDLRAKGALADDTLVTTIMSNYGLYKACDAAGISYTKTKVGDKYVYENMVEHGYSLGGEQSGHIIFRDFATTGDGILTSLMVMHALINASEGGCKASLGEMVAPMQMLPQVLKNVRVTDKEETIGDPVVKAACDEADKALEGIGRTLVRPSGTEPVVRVMAEAPDVETCEKYVDEIIAVMKERGFLVE